jgi:hypothetical protein
LRQVKKGHGCSVRQSYKGSTSFNGRQTGGWHIIEQAYWVDLESQKLQPTESAWRAGLLAGDSVVVCADGGGRIFSFGDGLLHGWVLQYSGTSSQGQGSDESGFHFHS